MDAMAVGFAQAVEDAAATPAEYLGSKAECTKMAGMRCNLPACAEATSNMAFASQLARNGKSIVCKTSC